MSRTQPSRRLPQPAEWSSGVRAFQVGATVLIAVVASVLLFLSARNGGRGSVGGPYILGWLGVFLLFGFWTAIEENFSRSNHNRLQVSTTCTGRPTTLIKCRKGPYYAYLATMGAFAAGPILGVFYCVFLIQDVPSTIVWLIVLIPAVLFFTGVSKGYYRRGYLELTKHGITVQGYRLKTVITWKDVTLVFPFAAHKWAIGIQGRDPFEGTYVVNDLPRRWRFLRHDFAIPGFLVIQPRLLEIDPTLAYHIVLFYWSNPQARVELGSDAVVRRASYGA